jgi:hypothetical protein
MSPKLSPDERRSIGLDGVLIEDAERAASLQAKFFEIVA